MYYIAQSVAARFSIDSESGVTAIVATVLLAGQNMTNSLNAVSNQLP